MKPARTWRSVIFGFVLPVLVSAGLVIWTVYDLEDTAMVWSSLWSASLIPLLVSIPASIASHLLRAIRWRRLIGEKVSLFYAFSSVMIGYAVNGVIPRGGEVVRIVNMNRMTGVPVALLLTTLIAERMLDLLSFLLVLALSIAIRGEFVSEKFPAFKSLAPFGLAVLGIGFAGLVIFALFSNYLGGFLGKAAGRIRPSFGNRVEEIVRQGGKGLTFVKEPGKMVAIFFETIFIWVFMWLTFVLGLYAFDLLEIVGIKGSVVTYTVTGASVFVPSAGAIGAFHKFGQESLVFLYQADPSRSLAFATVVHLIGYYVVPVGVGVLMWIGQIILHNRNK